MHYVQTDLMHNAVNFHRNNKISIEYRLHNGNNNKQSVDNIPVSCDSDKISNSVKQCRIYFLGYLIPECCSRAGLASITYTSGR